MHSLFMHYIAPCQYLDNYYERWIVPKENEFAVLGGGGVYLVAAA